MRLRNFLALTALGSLLGGAPAQAAPTAPPALRQGQNAHPEPTRRGRRVLTGALDLSAYGTISMAAPKRHPWVDKDGRLLRQVRRPLSWRIR